MSDPVKLLLVEDDPASRQALSALLGAQAGLTVVGAFGDGEAALAALDAGSRPDLALVDLGLTGIAGAALIRALKARAPWMDVLVLTVFSDRDVVFGALRAGATGYLLKGTPVDRLVASIFEAAQGGAPMSHSIARAVVASFQAGIDPSPLSRREHDVLTLLAQGLTYEHIGASLGIAIGTVQGHIKAIYRKLEVSSKAEATAEGIRRGLLKL